MTRAERFSAWKQDFLARTIAKGYAKALAELTIRGTKINPLVLEHAQNQPEFTKPIWSYVDGAVSVERLNGGRDKLLAHKDIFDAVSMKYGVNRYVLTSIWGLETAYGKIMGDYDIIDALATFAFEGRRKAFGESQLYAVLDMLARGDIRHDQLTGSWAGAMGMTQFIPTTFRDYAVDFDGNGDKDLWNSAGDTLGSAAHYLSRNGWRTNEPVLIEVVLPANFDYGLSDGTKRTVSGWAGMGIRPQVDRNWSQAELFYEAKLLIPTGHRGPVFLTFQNFDVIRKYNNSTSYVLGITVLSEYLKGKRAIMRGWPRNDEPLSRTDKKNLQCALTRQGFDTDGVDGQIGPNSRRAIRAWQQANGYPADGYVEQRLLARILSK